MEHDIETSGNHLYDDLMNYKDQANQNDNPPDQPRLNNSTTEPRVGVDETNLKLPTKERDESGFHTYAVLEEAIPPVPERYTRGLTHTKLLHIVKSLTANTILKGT